MDTLCEYCREPVNPKSRDTYYKIEGWAQRRDKGGPNRRFLKEVGKYMHHGCMRLWERRISPDQGRLV